MGVAKYIKNEKDAIEKVIYQSGIEVKPVYGPEDLEAVGFDYEKDLGSRVSTRSRGASILRAIVPGHGLHGSTPVLALHRKPTSVSNT